MNKCIDRKEKTPTPFHANLYAMEEVEDRLGK